jgi:hypothetical protein
VAAPAASTHEQEKSIKADNKMFKAEQSKGPYLL